MKPSLRQLEYFVAIAETGSFVVAADRCAVSQPSLSQQVQDMEGVLGQILFERSRAGAQLTPVGERILPLAREMLSSAKALKYLAQEDQQNLTGTIKLGALTSIGPYLLPYAAKQLHQRYPTLRLQVIEGQTEQLRNGLHAGRLDAFIGVGGDDERFTEYVLFNEDTYICSALDDPLGTATSPISPADLKDRELLSLGRGHHISTIVRRIADLGGAHVNSEYEGTSLDAIRQMSLMGFTVSVLPSLYCISEAKRDPDIFIRRIDHVEAHRTISLIWRKSSPLGARYEKLAAALRDTGEQLLGELI